MADYPILRYFEASHLPDDQRVIAGQFRGLAVAMVDRVGDQNPAEVAAGLRKLLEAQNCFVRASLP